MVTIQCIRAGNATKVIEVNPRFGGGVPLSICAGADFPGWLLDELRGTLTDAREGAGRMHDIIKDLKTFSRSDDDTIGPVDVNRVIESSVKIVNNQIRHRAELVCKLQSVPPVHGNASKLGQVFVNVLVNDPEAGSERAVWIEGEDEPREPGRVEFDGHEAVRFANGSRLEFAADAERRADESRLVVKYSYRQPFGRFSGSLDGIQLAEGIGVMEHQDAVW